MSGFTVVESTAWTPTRAAADTGGQRLLIVQSDGAAANDDSWTRAAESEGFDVEVVTSVHDALTRLWRTRAGLVLVHSLDPPDTWLELCRRMREIADIPVILGFPPHAQQDAVDAFELGVVGYVTDPGRIMELMARVRSVLRRGGAGGAGGARSGTFVAGEARIDLDRNEVSVDGAVVHMSRLELGLLALLLDPPNQVRTRDEIMEKVWAGRPYGSSRTLDTHVRWLRQKLETDPGDPRHLITVWGVGFRFDAERLAGSEGVSGC